jgi:mono/diheme cytochrome c family protein
MSGSRLYLTATIAVVMLVVGSFREASGQDDEYILSGRGTYMQYCTSCHGVDGRGEGTLADSLGKKVPDLTLMSSRYDGVFPCEYVLRTIDGRQEFLAHGTRQMPIWGNIWRPGEEDTHEAEVATQRTLNGLLHYLESIQRTTTTE